MSNVLVKEIVWGLSMMAVIFGFGFQMDESMFNEPNLDRTEPLD